MRPQKQLYCEGAKYQMVDMKPIEPTPILTGKDAERFVKRMMNLKYSAKKARFLKEAEEAYRYYILKER